MQGAQEAFGSKRVIQVLPKRAAAAGTLEDVFSEYDVRHIDFMVLDLEVPSSRCFPRMYGGPPYRGPGTSTSR